MNLPARFSFYLLGFVIISALVHPIISAPTKAKTANTEEKNTNEPIEESGQKLKGSHTIVRPTRIFKTKEELENTKHDLSLDHSSERDVRPFEWLYKHLNEYLMCVYGDHKDCEHKLAGAIKMEEMNRKLDMIKNQRMFYGPGQQGPMPNEKFAPNGGPIMWTPNGPYPNGFYPYGPQQMDLMEKTPRWQGPPNGPMGMNGPNYPFPPGQGPFGGPFNPEKAPQMPPGPRFDEPTPVLLSLRDSEQRSEMESKTQKNDFMRKMEGAEKKDDSESEKTGRNQWTYGNQYLGMIPSSMYGVPNFVAQ